MTPKEQFQEWYKREYPDKDSLPELESESQFRDLAEYIWMEGFNESTKRNKHTAV